jgi:hypothetical protein
MMGPRILNPGEHSMKLLLMTLLSLAVSVQAALAYTGTPSVPLPILTEQRLNQSALHAPIVKLGSQVTQKKVNVMKAVLDVSVLSGGNGIAEGEIVVLKDAAGGDAVLPKGAIVKQVIIDTITAFTAQNGTGTAQVRLGVETEAATDLKVATNASSYTGILAGTPVGTAASSVKVTSTNKAVVASLSGGSVTAGKYNIFIEYYLSNET